MKVLVACEFSGIVREAFIRKGHDAMSCDLEPTEIDGPHYQGDVRDILNQHWDLIIAHPPCDYLAVCGNRTYSNRPDLYLPAAEFAKMFHNYAEKVCVENPKSRLTSLWRKPDQYIQPWEYGHGEVKKTGLWLKGLPLLKPTNIVAGREQRVWLMSPSATRKKDRSRFFTGIAEAMADQWTLLP